MKQHVLILGAGFGGLKLATRPSETLRDEVRVTLLDRNDSFVFGHSTRKFNADVNWVEIDVDEDAEDADHYIKPEERLAVAMGIQ